MKREEQNEKSRNRILQAALKEYGSKNFSETSINTICKENGISKGLIYHYFENVDQLFLACVDECFTQMYEY
ncbi:MAG: TetR/AcrR family transcriptional regulator, partial [Niameybacter sp.]